MDMAVACGRSGGFIMLLGTVGTFVAILTIVTCVITTHQRGRFVLGAVSAGIGVLTFLASVSSSCAPIGAMTAALPLVAGLVSIALSRKSAVSGKESS
jgi:hypothetical protein